MVLCLQKSYTLPSLALLLPYIHGRLYPFALLQSLSSVLQCHRDLALKILFSSSGFLDVQLQW